MKKIFCFLLVLLSINGFANSFIGFYEVESPDNKGTAVAYLYEYKSKFYIKIVATMQNGEIYGTLDQPKDTSVYDKQYNTEGLDLVWDLVLKGEELKSGKIINPENGKIFNANAWLIKDAINVKASFLGLGVTITWKKFTPKAGKQKEYFDSVSKRVLTPIIPKQRP